MQKTSVADGWQVYPILRTKCGSYATHKMLFTNEGSYAFFTVNITDALTDENELVIFCLCDFTVETASRIFP